MNAIAFDDLHTTATVSPDARRQKNAPLAGVLGRIQAPGQIVAKGRSKRNIGEA